MEYKNQATKETIEKILSRGVKNMPQNPAACGYKPEQIRKFYYEVEELTLELLKNIEEKISEIITNVTNLVIEVETLPEASSDTIGKIYVIKNQIISKEKDLYRWAYTTMMQDDKYIWLKVSDNMLATLLLEGEGKYSIATQEDDNRKNEAHGRSGISAGRLSKTYQRATFSFGGNNQSGMREEEFKAYFWDANHLNEDGSYGAPINGGKGLDADGNVLDRDGRKYEESYGYEFTTGQENKNYGKSTLVGGEYNTNYGLASLLVGKGLFNTGDFSVLLGGRETSSTIPWRIINKGLRNLFFGYFLNSYNTTYEKDFNDCVLLGSGLVPSNDGCVGVGANGGDKHNSEGILRFFVGAGKGFLFDEKGNPIIDSETGKQKFEGFNALEVYEGGRVSVAKKPELETEVARLKEINELDKKLNTKIDTLHANGFIVVQTLPSASRDTVGKIYLISREGSVGKDVFDEYITVSSDSTFVWEKIGSTEFKMIDEEELLEAVTKALDGKLDKITSTGLFRLYGIDSNGKQKEYVVASSAGACQEGRVAMYHNTTSIHGDTKPPACLITGTPQKPYQSTPKIYVDEAVANAKGLFRFVHNINISVGGTSADGFSTSILSRITGISKYGTTFTYVQGKGISLGTFNYQEHADIMEFGIQPTVFTLTSAWLHDLADLVFSPKVEILIEANADYTERTIYLTKIEDIDLTNLKNFYDYVTEA